MKTLGYLRNPGSLSSTSECLTLGKCDLGASGEVAL